MRAEYDRWSRGWATPPAEFLAGDARDQHVDGSDDEYRLARERQRRGRPSGRPVDQTATSSRAGLTPWQRTSQRGATRSATDALHASRGDRPPEASGGRHRHAEEREHGSVADRVPLHYPQRVLTTAASPFEQ